MFMNNELKYKCTVWFRFSKIRLNNQHVFDKLLIGT